MKRYDLLHALLAVDDRLSRAMGEAAEAVSGVSERAGSWLPASDVRVAAGKMTIAVDLPGVPREALKLELTEMNLVLSGVRPGAATEDGPCRFRRLESDRGPFRRTYPLPRGADGEAISSRLERGVLTITVPLATAAGGKQVIVS